MYGKKIKDIRKINGKTQQEVSVGTNIPQNTISWIEKGKGIPNIEQCAKLADFFGVSVDYLIGREDDFGVINNVNNSLLSDDEKELLYTYRALSKQDKQKAINVIKTAFNK